MELGDLLLDGVVGGVEDGTAEDDDAVGFEVGGGDGGDLEVQLFPVADDDHVELVVVVHHVEFGDAGHDLAVDGEDEIALFEDLVGAGLDLANHEELVTLRVVEFDFANPVLRDTHDARL